MGGPPLLGAIADDLTGATDLCSILVRAGMRTVQTTGVVRGLELPEVDALVVGLKTRTAPVARAVSESLESLEWLRELGADRFFFKYCSTFDSTPEGNIGPVADALLDALGRDFTVVCPAYPANGRTVYQGHLFVGDTLLSDSPMAHHPLTPMTDANLVRFFARQTPRAVGLVPLDVVRRGPRAVSARFDELRSVGVAYAVTDATQDDDLRVLGAACEALPLVTGGAGIALGLAERLAHDRRGRADAPAPERPAIVLAGSCSAATREQVARMAARYPAFKVDVLEHAANGGIDAVAAEAAAALRAGPVLVYTTSPPEEVARVQERLGVERASEVAEGLLADLARRLVDSGARTVVVAGGETSAAVVQALGVRALAVGDELAPGVPWMSSLDGRSLTLALKSGNFGGPEFFLGAVEAAR